MNDARCEITGNPCGTDTWGAGFVCICPACLEWLSANQVRLDADADRILHENLWTLYG